MQLGMSVMGVQQIVKSLVMLECSWDETIIWFPKKHIYHQAQRTFFSFAENDFAAVNELLNYLCYYIFTSL